MTNIRNKQIFLDCGSNLGQAFEGFRERYPLTSYEFILFEPNPSCYYELLNKYMHTSGVHVTWAAVHVQDSWMTLKYKSAHDVGATVVAEHNSAFDKTEYVYECQVPSIDLDRLVGELHDQSYQISIKLDIESSEYAILEKMIRSGNLGKIKTLYCEFHSQYMNETDRQVYLEREAHIVDQIHKAGVDFYLWS